MRKLTESEKDRVLQGVYYNTAEHLSLMICLELARETNHIADREEQMGITQKCSDLINEYSKFSFTVLGLIDNENELVKAVDSFISEKILNISRSVDFTPSKKILRDVVITLNTFMHFTQTIIKG